MSHVNSDGQVVKSFVEHNENVVYPVTHNLVDLFWGEEFENHARFKWSGKDWALWSKTSPLPKGFIKSLEYYRKVVRGDISSN